MDKDTKKLINDIARDCRETVGQWIKENWRRASGDPVDTYVTYGTKYRDDIKRLCNEGHKNELYAAMGAAVRGLEGLIIAEECLCLRCGYGWSPKKPNPKQCPFCHSMKWNIPKSE
jgi:predicted Zn-ribbon and HTH transcriptional regulator